MDIDIKIKLGSFSSSNPLIYNCATRNKSDAA